MLYNSFMNTNELCNIAQKNNIRIHYESLQKDGAAVYYNNKYEIVLSKSLLSSQIKERESLAEELAHCLTGTVYPISLATTTLGRLIIASAERVARQTAATLLVPLDTLKSLLDLPIYEIADELDVSEKTVLIAVEYYQLRGLL